MDKEKYAELGRKLCIISDMCKEFDNVSPEDLKVENATEAIELLDSYSDRLIFVLDEMKESISLMKELGHCDIILRLSKEGFQIFGESIKNGKKKIMLVERLGNAIKKPDNYDNENRYYIINECEKRQKLYCKTLKQPYLAPAGGICFKCNEQIYDRISIEEAGKNLITDCPHCNHSFLD